MHCAYWYVTVIEEGNPSHYFPKIVHKHSTPSTDTSPSSSSSSSQSHLPDNLPPHLRGDDNEDMLEDYIRDIPQQSNSELAETIRQVRQMGYTVDDDNEALPENLPDGKSQVSSDGDDGLLQLGQSWGCDGIDERAKCGVEKTKPKLRHGMFSFENLPYLQIFLLFFPLCL